MTSQIRRQFALFLPPGKGEHPLQIDEQDRRRYKIAEDGLHPGAHFQALAGVGFGNKIVPSPTKTVAAEQCQYQAAQRQHIVGYNKIPKVQPGGAGGERLEVQHAVAQGRRQTVEIPAEELLEAKLL